MNCSEQFRQITDKSWIFAARFTRVDSVLQCYPVFSTLLPVGGVVLCFWWTVFTSCSAFEHYYSTTDQNSRILKLLPSLLHSCCVSAVLLWEFLGMSIGVPFQWMSIYSLGYLSMSLLFEWKKLHILHKVHHIVTSWFYLLSFIPSTCSPWLLWLVGLGGILEITTPLLNFIKISESYQVVQRYVKWRKSQKNNVNALTMSAIVDISLTASTTIWVSTCVFIIMFFAVRIVFPLYLTKVVLSGLEMIPAVACWTVENEGDLDMFMAYLLAFVWICFTILQIMYWYQILLYAAIAKSLFNLSTTSNNKKSL